MNVHIQRRSADLGDPALEVGEEVLLGGGRALVPHAQRGEEGGADHERAGVEGDRRARAGDRDQHAGERRAEHHPEVLGDAHQRVRLLQVLAARDLRDEPAGGGPEARVERAVERDEHDDVPQLGRCR